MSTQIIGLSNTNQFENLCYQVINIPAGCSINSITLPSGWILISQTPVTLSTNPAIGWNAIFCVFTGSTNGTITVSFSCIYGSTPPVTLEVTLNPQASVNLSGICCNEYAVANLDTVTWTKSDLCATFRIQAVFNDTTDANSALGQATFISSAHATIALCMADLVAQINAGAAAHPANNPEGLSPATYLGTMFSMKSFPTPNAPMSSFVCGQETYITFSSVDSSGGNPCVVIPTNSEFAIFNGTGTPVPCFGPPTIQGDPFVCTGDQVDLTVIFPGGIPKSYSLTTPLGWTVVGTTVKAFDTLLVSLIPDSSNGTVIVSYLNSVGGTYVASFNMVNDCFIGNCASQILLSEFCNDTDPCCKECNDYEKAERKLENEMMNKAVALITTYALAKQNYFMDCLQTDLPALQVLVSQIQSILIRCNVCPTIK